MYLQILDDAEQILWTSHGELIKFGKQNVSSRVEGQPM